MTFEAIVYDEMTGNTDRVVVKASCLETAIDLIEGDENHEYEIIEIEHITTWNA